MHSNKVTIIILNWNQLEHTLECLESVRQIDYPNYDVIVIDNGSTNDSVSGIRTKYPDVRLLELEKNIGFAGGNNVGLRYALSKDPAYILLLNNDTIVDLQILNKFVEAAVSIPAGGIFAGKIYYYDKPDTIWYAGGQWNDERSQFVHIGRDSVDDGDRFNSIKETDYACGCALFARSEVIKQIGFLEEIYFLMCEDTEWCYRAKALGYKSIFVPEAKVWHKISTTFGGQNSPLVVYFMMRNRLLWGEKYLSFKKKLKLYKSVCGELLWHLFSNLDLPSNQSSNIWPFNKFTNGFSQLLKQLKDSINNPVDKARLFGVRDYMFRRFGDCSASIRALGK